MVEVVFEEILNTGDELVATFLERISEIYAHTQKVIIDFLETLNEEQLLLLRADLFEKCIQILLSYNQYELITRRKKKLICEDIYVLGYCVVNGLEDRRLKNIVKPKPANDSVISEADTSLQDNEELDLRQFCVSLKSAVDALTTQVCRLKTRVGILEEDLTSANCEIQKLRSDDNVVMTKTTQKCESRPTRVLGSGSQDSEKTSRNQARKPDWSISPKQPKTEVIISSPPQSLNDVASKRQTKYEPEISLQDQGFQHPKHVRNKIVRGQVITQAANSDVGLSSKIVTGSSHGNYSIKAAAPLNPDSESSGSVLVYVGRLAKDSTEQSVRNHLANIGVTVYQIADVIKLKCRKDNETSFCISLNDKSAHRILFESDNWPAGIRVRTFKQSPIKNKTSRAPLRMRNAQSAPPRFRNRVKSQGRDLSCNHNNRCVSCSSESRNIDSDCPYYASRSGKNYNLSLEPFKGRTI